MQKLIDEIKKTSGDMARRGWAESNGGNISLRLNSENYACFNNLQAKSEPVKLPISMPEIAGERFLVTGTGRFLRNIEVFPEKNVGVIEIDDKGESWQLLWGYEPIGAPTSELPSHLLSHCRIKEKTHNQSFAFIHTHPNSIIALTYAVANLDTKSLSQLLWQSHAECVVVFPQGIEFLPWVMAGSMDLGKATAEAMARRNLAVWQFHGICGCGRNLDEAFGRIDVAEKAADICLRVMAAGGARQTLSDAQIRAIAANFNCNLDESLFA
ncbi:MAG: rhamnulose-1-phosphate aldolase [Bacteroidales bacterium]